MAIDLAPYKPAAASAVDATPIDTAFDLIQAAVNGGLQKLFDLTLSGDAATIDTGAVLNPGGFAHLLIECYARGDTAAAAVELRLRANNDSGANYDSLRTIFQASSTTFAETPAGTAWALGSCPANTAPANAFGAFTAKVNYYAQATNHKAVTAQSHYRQGTTTGNYRSEIGGGTWFAAPAALNRLILFPAAGNLRAGTRFTVYGMGF